MKITLLIFAVWIASQGIFVNANTCNKILDFPETDPGKKICHDGQVVNSTNSCCWMKYTEGKTRYTCVEILKNEEIIKALITATEGSGTTDISIVCSSNYAIVSFISLLLLLIF